MSFVMSLCDVFVWKQKQVCRITAIATDDQVVESIAGQIPQLGAENGRASSDW
jgi:hypothetical protein